VFTERYALIPYIKQIRFVFKGLILKNSTRFSHCVYVFVWISEQTAITFLYSINRFVFVTETESVYCAVRTSSSYIKQIRFVFKGLVGHNSAQGKLCIYSSEAVEVMSKQTPKNELKLWMSLLFSSL
jgi:hypothetical protein